MTTISAAKRRRGSSSALSMPTTGAAAATAVLLLTAGAGRLHHALAFGTHASTFTTARQCGTGSDIGIVLTALHAETPGGTGGSTTGGSWSSSPSSSHHAQSRRDHKTAMEGAILVEWEPISELERRIEDGIHYEHFPDFEHMRQQARIDRRRSGGGGGGGRVDENQVDSTTDHGNVDGNMDGDDANLKLAQGVFVGFRVTEEEVDRLRSADPADYSV